MVIATDLVCRACLRKRIRNKGRQQQLVLHAATGTHSRSTLRELRTATLEARLERLGVLRSFSRPRVSNDNPYSELFRTAKYRPAYPSNPFISNDHAGQWVAAFINSYNHRHSGIIFVTPHQRHCGQAVGICKHLDRAYGKARKLNLRRWSRTTHCGIYKK